MFGNRSSQTQVRDLLQPTHTVKLVGATIIVFRFLELR
jgi:hypothetical protein